MLNILLSSRAFCSAAITDAFLSMFPAVDRANAAIVIIVNAVDNGKRHPQMLALQQTVRQLGFTQVQLLDVLTDDLTVLDTADAIILNGGYEFLLLKSLQRVGLLSRLRQLALTGKPIYGISAGAILLGPDLDLYATLYPEDNVDRLTVTTAIAATAVRIYPHYDRHCEYNPQLPQLITDWERRTGQIVTRLTNSQGRLLQGTRVEVVE